MEQQRRTLSADEPTEVTNKLCDTANIDTARDEEDVSGECDQVAYDYKEVPDATDDDHVPDGEAHPPGEGPVPDDGSGPPQAGGGDLENCVSCRPKRDCYNFIQKPIRKRIRRGCAWAWADISKPHLIWIKLIFFFQSAR